MDKEREGESKEKEKPSAPPLPSPSLPEKTQTEKREKVSLSPSQDSPESSSCAESDVDKEMARQVVLLKEALQKARHSFLREGAEEEERAEESSLELQSPLPSSPPQKEASDSPIPSLSDRKEDGSKKKTQGGLAQALNLSSNFFAHILVGGILGLGLDHWLGISPFGLLFFLLLGFSAGILSVIRETKSETSDPQTRKSLLTETLFDKKDHQKRGRDSEAGMHEDKTHGK